MNIKAGLTLNNSFVIESPLSSRGGTASVYLARPLNKPDLKAAVKFAHSDARNVVDEDVLLRHEAGLLSQPDWRHPGILRLYPIIYLNKVQYVLRATGVENEPSFFMMEYLPGKTLSEWMDKVFRYSFDWKIEFLYQLATTLAFIHSKGYGHRDIKPDNILFRAAPTASFVPQPVLIDFALASDGKTALSLIESSYTLEYASPERVMKASGLIPEEFSLKPEPQDVWSFGLIVYELFTGSLPFRGTAKDIRTTLISRSFDEKYIKENPNLPNDIADFIRAILKPDPEKRPTMRRIIDLLEQKYRPPRV
jgi:serine/threonine-protein kinase